MWKWLVGVLSSVLLTGLASWFSFGGTVTAEQLNTRLQEFKGDLLTKDQFSEKLKDFKSDVRLIVEKESPYARDEKAISGQLGVLSNSVAELKTGQVRFGERLEEFADQTQRKLDTIQQQVLELKK